MKNFKQYPDGFFWDHIHGIGHSSVKPITYGQSYFYNYVERDKTAMGKALTRARVDFVNDNYPDKNMVDVGIGGGGFVRAMDCYGFDVCEDVTDWLCFDGKFIDINQECVGSASFWDSLEHIPEPDKVLRNIKKYVFISMPIYRDKEHCLSSKHYKPGEHIWYFTHNGLIWYMEQQGFTLADYSSIETKLGREDIGSYAFKRVRNAE